MKPSPTLWLALAGAFLVLSPARAQTDSAKSLLDALSLVTGGALTALGPTPQVTQEGDQFHVRVPLPKLVTPADAAIDAAATQLDTGAWKVTGVSFPQTATLWVTTQPGKPPESVGYAIGRQSIHAQLDPTFASQSSYGIELGDIAVTDSTAQPGEHLTLGSLTWDGTITGDTKGLMTTRSVATADNWELVARSSAGALTTLSLRSLKVRSNIDGLDRARAMHLRENLAAIAANQSPPVPGQPSTPSPMQREQIRAMLDILTGMLSGMSVEESFQGLHFETANGDGDIGEIRIAMAGQVRNDYIAAHSDIGLSDMAFPTVPAAFAPIVPRRIALRTAVSGIQAEALRRLVREAMADGANPAALQSRAIALLNEPGARAGIESLSVEAGPLLLQGSGRVRPLPDGTAAFDLHLAAHGLDALIALVQTEPQAQQVMPMLFMVRGMGKPESGDTVWDIAFAHGITTVNGAPLGPNPNAPRPPARP